MGDHDKLFKRAFSLPKHAGQELRCVLPQALAHALDLDNLERVPGSFVDPQLRARHTDLLFRAPRRAHPNQDPAYLYLLVEHQSHPDPLMAWRILEYQHRIWSRILRGEPRRTTLPPILTLVVHHGSEGWTVPRRFHDLIEGLDDVPGLARFVPDFSFLVDDLATTEGSLLAGRRMDPFQRVVLWLLRDGRSLESLMQHLEVWAHALSRLAERGDSQDLEVALRYILNRGGEASLRAFRDRLAEVAPEVEEPMSSIAERLIQEGMEKGLEEGLKEGLKQGRRDALRAILARQLRARFGALSPDLERQLAEATENRLDRWIDRVLTATSPEDLLGA